MANKQIPGRWSGQYRCTRKRRTQYFFHSIFLGSSWLWVFKTTECETTEKEEPLSYTCNNSCYEDVLPGAAVLAHWVQLPSTRWYQITGLSPGCSTSDSTICSCHWESSRRWSKYGPTTWIPLICLGDLGGVPDVSFNQNQPSCCSHLGVWIS